MGFEYKLTPHGRKIVVKLQMDEIKEKKYNSASLLMAALHQFQGELDNALHYIKEYEKKHGQLTESDIEKDEVIEDAIYNFIIISDVTGYFLDHPFSEAISPLIGTAKKRCNTEFKMNREERRASKKR